MILLVRLYIHLVHTQAIAVFETQRVRVSGRPTVRSSSEGTRLGAVRRGEVKRGVARRGEVRRTVGRSLGRREIYERRDFFARVPNARLISRDSRISLSSLKYRGTERNGTGKRQREKEGESEPNLWQNP